ncbi:MAG: DUF2933 domain-containing protein [archaeon]
MNSKNLLWMAVCCLVPLIVIGIIFFFGFNQSYLTVIALLLCPLLHIFMMKGMHKEKPDVTKDNKSEADVTKNNKEESCH